MNPILYAKGKQAKQLELKKKLNENLTAIDAMIDAMSEGNCSRRIRESGRMMPPEQRYGKFTSLFI